MKSPGPGTYDIKARDSSPGWKIGTSKRDAEEKMKNRFSKVPSPSQYNPSINYVTARQASYSFGSSIRNGITGDKQ